MSGEERREKVLNVIRESDKPVSASALAKQFKVSRQIIVGDIALLRAGNIDILATNKGYIINARKDIVECVIKVRHKSEDIYDELCTIIDMGAKVVTEEIENDLYGRIVTEININSREDARLFSEKCLDASQRPLSELTRGVHYHKIKAEGDLAVIRVQKALNEKGYLAK